MKKRPTKDSTTSVKVIAIYRDKILLMKNPDGTYELPGGHLEVGEAPVTGAHREFKEETGLVTRFLRVIDRKPKRIIYKGTLTSTNVKISSEHKSFKFVKPDEVHKLKLSDKAKKDLAPFKKPGKKKKQTDEEIAADPRNPPKDG